MAFAHGHLQSPETAPDSGERILRLAELGHVVVEQILSGRLDGPVDYRQDVDEWVTVLHGGATLVVEDQTVHLGPGDWVMLRAAAPHRLVETQPGTSWLTITSTTPEGPRDNPRL